MHPNAALITRFYNAFQQKDIATMRACYHPDIVFNDSVFVDLRGSQAGMMWQMLLERGKDLRLTFSDVTADDKEGSAHWEAYYTFSRTGRTVHNVIDASFKFKDGLIIEHRDHFNFWRWSRQSLGLPGLLLGWLPPLQGQLQRQSKKTLEAYIAKQGGEA